ncbi:MAG: hypothetical protein Q4D41_12970, partial [Prevotellaceae bacterium]|nr:hypothetical protein [Prevotellaceae bacterium]
MNTNIYKVVNSGEMITLPSKKAESGTINKRVVLLKEMGNAWANEYVCSLFGNNATLQLYKDDLVAAALSFTTSEHNDKTYQEITVTD